jgi:hypothetical protein
MKITSHQFDLEVLVAIEDLLGVVAFAAGVHDRQRALAEQLVQAAGAGIEQFLDLRLRKILETAARSDAGIHEVGNDDAGFQENPLDPSTLLLVSSVLDAGVMPCPRAWGGSLL